MEYLTLKGREPRDSEIEAMRLYIETGCVTEDYLREVLGNQNKVISVFPQNKRALENSVV